MTPTLVDKAKYVSRPGKWPCWPYPIRKSRPLAPTPPPATLRYGATITDEDLILVLILPTCGYPRTSQLLGAPLGIHVLIIRSPNAFRQQSTKSYP